MFDDNTPLISVIIPTYGRAELLSRAIDSVLKQTYQNLEIIVINDNHLNSKHYQPTVMIMKKYENNSKVKFISDGGNAGGSLARNKGIDASLGEYISFLDDDDYYYPEKIEKQLECLLIHNADLCICDMHIEQPNGDILNLNKCRANGSDLGEFIVNGNCYTPMIFAKKIVLIQVGLFTETPRFQDHVLMLKILEKGYIVHELHKPLFIHNNHDNDRITNLNSTKKSLIIRREIENRNLNVLDRKQLRKYYFKSAINNLIFFNNISIAKSYKEILFNISDKEDVYKFLSVTKNLILKKYRKA